MIVKKIFYRNNLHLYNKEYMSNSNSNDESQIINSEDEWEKLAYDFLLEEKKINGSIKTCSACSEDLLQEEILICLGCLGSETEFFFHKASEISNQ